LAKEDVQCHCENPDLSRDEAISRTTMRSLRGACPERHEISIRK
jgi:hypothetical protein